MADAAARRPGYEDQPGQERSSRVPFLRSIRAKYALTYLLVVAAIIAVMNTYPLIMVEDMVFSSKATALRRQALVIGSALSVSETLTAESAGQTMALLEDVQATRVLVTDGEGRILYDNSTLDNRLGDYALMGEVTAALSGSDVWRLEYRDGAFRGRSAVPVVYRGEILGAVYLYEYDSGQADILLSIQNNLRNISIFIGAAAAVLALLFSEALTRSAGRLLAAIRRLRSGEYDNRAVIRGRDEMAQLADEFNRMAGRLQTTEEARRRFVSDASHELKTPLASIRLLTDSILQNDSVDMGTVREFVSDIGDEADRLTRISERLLTLTRLDAVSDREREPVELGAVTGRVADMLQPLAEENHITLTRKLEPACALLANEDDLYQVAFNLIENAIKYNVPGGRVDVSVSRQEGKVVLAVADTGVGVPEEDRPRIFDRFYRVDKARSRERGGTGLGLSIARETARLHNGDITVEPNPAGKGSIFYAEFPALTAEGGGPG